MRSSFKQWKREKSLLFYFYSRYLGRTEYQEGYDRGVHVPVDDEPHLVQTSPEVPRVPGQLTQTILAF